MTRRQNNCRNLYKNCTIRSFLYKNCTESVQNLYNLITKRPNRSFLNQNRAIHINQFPSINRMRIFIQKMLVNLVIVKTYVTCDRIVLGHCGACGAVKEGQEDRVSVHGGMSDLIEYSGSGGQINQKVR